jgi:SAM-dependent methyltransferase
LSSRFAYDRYLLAKRTVDDRALNAGLLERLRRELLAFEERVPRVLEIGAGMGTMPARLVEWGVLKRAHYTLLDRNKALLAASRAWLSEWGQAANFVVRQTADGLHLHLENERGESELTLNFMEADVAELAESTPRYDLLIANAVLDVVDVPAVLPALLSLVSDQGLYWFCSNFDGQTSFSPEHPADAALLAVYHRSMDERALKGRGAGHSQTGRRLFGHLTTAGASILCAGASDWVVFGSEGRYTADEAHFLRCIVQTVHDEVVQHADVDNALLSEWTALRLAQIERGELVYIAHQLDFLGQPHARS